MARGRVGRPPCLLDTDGDLRLLPNVAISHLESLNGCSPITGLGGMTHLSRPIRTFQIGTERT